MSELDFDELDKAVNTLMGDVPNAEPSKPDDTKTLNINSTLSDTARPSLAELNSALTQVNSPAATPVAAPVISTPLSAPTSPLAARRGGRFMDVVHPSSDMKGAVRPAGVSSRQGVTIEPSEKLLLAKSEDQTASEQPSPTALFANETHDVVPTKDISSEQETTQNDWPDPLEMSGYGVEPDTTSVTTASENALVDADISADSASPIVSAAPEEVQPLTSPFIADAKVDKRPLGGAPSEEQSGELDRAPMLGSLATNAMASTDPSDQLPANPSEVEPQLPPELQSDLMAIETDGDTSAGTETSKEAPAVTPAVATTVVEKVPVASVVSAAAVAAPAAGPTSITQQYHEEPSTSDQTNGSIYDMASYHQPLAHPVKKKSGWLWIVWILLLLIIGGGSAAALYFFDII